LQAKFSTMPPYPEVPSALRKLRDAGVNFELARSQNWPTGAADLAPMVGANLDETDARRMRGIRPCVFSNLKSGKGADEIAHFILQKGGLASTDLLA
jgi:hypothetical protein